MREIAYLLFPGMTLLDFVGVYDALRRVRPTHHRFTGTVERFADELMAKP